MWKDHLVAEFDGRYTNNVMIENDFLKLKSSDQFDVLMADEMMLFAGLLERKVARE